MKKFGIALAYILLLLFLASCAPQDDQDEVLQEEEGAEQQTSIIPRNQLNEQTYRIILPYETSEARGVILNQMANRVDIDELEEGLIRHSKEVYDPEKYYFQEGQYIKSDELFSWIDELNPKLDNDKLEKMEKDEKIKTYRDNPRFLSHILEQNYLVRNEDSDSVSLGGVSIGIALKSVYQFQTETGGPSYYEEIPKGKMLEEGKKIAQDILEKLRQKEGLETVPIMIALFQEEEQNSPVPGNFVAKTFVSSGENSIGDWETINEENILFPSDEGQDKYLDDYEIINSFGNEIAEFFPNYVGIIGKGFYINEELQKLTIEVPIEFYGKAEVTGFMQYTYGLINDTFAKTFDLEVEVTSSNGVEGIIYRQAGEEEANIYIRD